MVIINIIGCYKCNIGAINNIILVIANINLIMAIIIAITFFAIATNITNNKHNNSVMDFHNSHGKVYATSRTEHLE